MRAKVREVSAILNADDLGMSGEVNETIFELMDRGRITSASLLANAPATAEAVRMVKQFPQCSFGAHLNIVEYEPLRRTPGLAPLLDNEGRLRPIPSGFRFTVALLRAIQDELKLQIEKLLSSGIHISHFDSHMHVHLRPALFPVIKALQLTYKIRKIRTRHDLLAGSVSWPRKLKRFAHKWALRRLYNTITTDSGAELSQFLAARWASQPRFRTLELISHPGNPYYPNDRALLLAPWEQTLPFRLHFINFHQLG